MHRALDGDLLPAWQTREVDRLPAGESLRLYTDYIATNRPVLVTDAVEDWPARTRWTRAYLIDHFGDHEVPVVDIRTLTAVPDLTLAETCRLLDEGHDHLYLIDWSLPKQCPELLNALGPMPMACLDWLCFKPDGAVWPTLFLGPAQSHTGFHVDAFGSHAWNTVLWGTKLFLLLPPEAVTVLEQADRRGTRRKALHGNVFYRDAHTIPGMTEVRPTLAVVRAGDTLYTPHGWLHTVLNLEETLAVTGNWVDECCHPAAFAQLDPAVRTTGLQHARRLLEAAHPHMPADLRAARRLRLEAAAAGFPVS